MIKICVARSAGLLCACVRLCVCLYVTHIHTHREEEESKRDHVFQTNENNLQATSKICFTKYLLYALFALTVAVFLGLSIVCEMGSLCCTCITYSPIFFNMSSQNQNGRPSSRITSSRAQREIQPLRDYIVCLMFDSAM